MFINLKGNNIVFIACFYCPKMAEKIAIAGLNGAVSGIILSKPETA